MAKSNEGGNPMKAVETRASPAAEVRTARHPVRLTALLYLREALRSERYEECAQFALTAREFGASQREVEELLEDARRLPC